MATTWKRYRDTCLRFLTDPVIPFTNNLAEGPAHDASVDENRRLFLDC